MTNLLKTAIEELSKLSEEEQDAVAAAILEELRSEQKWSELFAATTEEQWAGMTESVRRLRKERSSLAMSFLAVNNLQHHRRIQEAFLRSACQPPEAYPQ